MSHRSKEFIEIAEQAEKDFRSFLNVPKNFEVFFLLGGATG
jgi:phosphoserine aminotransferase